VTLVDRHRVPEQAVARGHAAGGDRCGARSRRRREDASVVGKPRRMLPEFAQKRGIAWRDQIGPEAVADDDDGAFHAGPPLWARVSRARMRWRRSGGNGVFSPVALTTRISTARPSAQSPSRHTAYSISKLVFPRRTVRALTKISSE